MYYVDMKVSVECIEVWLILLVDVTEDRSRFLAKVFLTKFAHRTV